MVRLALRVLLLAAIAGLSLWIVSWLYDRAVAEEPAGGEGVLAASMMPSASSAGAPAPASTGPEALRAPSAAPEPAPLEAPSPVLLVAPVEREERSEPSPIASVPLELAASLRCQPIDAFEHDLSAFRGELSATNLDLLRSSAAAFAGRMDEARTIARSIARSEEVDPRDRAALDALLSAGERAQVAGTEGTIYERAVAIRTADARARAARARGDLAGAVQELSRLVRLELDAPWPASRELLARWSADLAAAQESVRWNPQADWAALEISVEPGDSVSRVRQRAIAQNPSLRVCTGMIERSNRLTRQLQPGMRLKIPTDDVAVLVDLEARWLVMTMAGDVVAAWEVAVGREGHDTERGDFRVGDMQVDPMWFPAGQPPVPHGDARNPLGTRWIGWERADGTKTGLGIHGTNEPGTVGSAASDGCVRMRNEDVERLYTLVPRGAPIHVR